MKYRSHIRVTRELLEQALNLPEAVEIAGVQWDEDREILKLILRSEEEVEGYTYSTGEAASTMSIDYNIKEAKKNA